MDLAVDIVVTEDTARGSVVSVLWGRPKSLLARRGARGIYRRLWGLQKVAAIASSMRIAISTKMVSVIFRMSSAKACLMVRYPTYQRYT